MSKEHREYMRGGQKEEYEGSTFREVRDQVFSDPYDTLPEYKITLGSLYQGVNNALLQASRRALTNKKDLVDHFQRLVHPLGIAMTGTWEITEDNPYTGLFRPGTKALLIARGSTLLDQTLQGQYRGFAFAGKLFPTLDPDERVKTTDFFTIDVLAGTQAKYFTGVDLSNHPPLGFNYGLFKLFWIINATFAAFIRADWNPVMRPLYQLGEYGVPDEKLARTPRWMMVKGWGGSGQVDTPDYRDELVVEKYKGGRLIFDVYTADEKLRTGARDYKRIGKITLDASVRSDSCDHRLKYRHPPLKKYRIL
jgi:hypothetical protein